ncbi:MAG: hypothetical protein L3J43_04850 [Sulfurovum sp.]|nr:hypothetical protein [Sulfurovum sp.]
MSNDKKDFASKVNAVKKTAPLQEQKEERKKKHKAKGQPRKDEKEKQKIPIGIYVNQAQLDIIEQKAQKEGYSPKDRAKWIKAHVTSKNDDVMSEYKREIETLKQTVKFKDEMIEILKAR